MTMFKDLAAPFSPEEVHWRVGSTNAKKLGVKPWEATKGLPLAYLDARNVMERLDAVVGPTGWEDSYKETPSGRVICSLSIVLDDALGPVTKSDGAGDTGTEGEKGAISDAFKRAAVKFGIGRYLYSVKSGWIDLENGKIPQNWINTEGKRALSSVKIGGGLVEYNALVREHWHTIAEVKNLLHPQWGEMENQPNVTDARAALKEAGDDTYRDLWKAPTKGGIFTTVERTLLKEPEKALQIVGAEAL